MNNVPACEVGNVVRACLVLMNLIKTEVLKGGDA